MSNRRWAGFLIALGVALCPSVGRAQMMFGTNEQFTKIQPTKDPGYMLSYKTSTFFFIAGCYVKDDGYVLQPVGESNKYLPLDAATTQQLQQEGTLPTPLPTYSLSFWDYLVGYSNWIILAFVVGVSLIVRVFRNTKKPTVQRSLAQSPMADPQAGAVPETAKPADNEVCHLCGKPLEAGERASRVCQACATP